MITKIKKFLSEMWLRFCLRHVSEPDWLCHILTRILPYTTRKIHEVNFYAEYKVILYLTVITQIKHQMKDPLYKNSFFIMLTTITNSGFGFIFWMIAAKFYPKEDVGISPTNIV